MRERFADRVIMPDVVGLPFHVGRDVAHDAGVVLANPDPDGPPISGLAWPGLFWITSQDPAPGAGMYRWDSVRIEISAYGEADRGASAPPPRRPPGIDAHARAEHPAGMDERRTDGRPRDDGFGGAADPQSDAHGV